MACRGDLRLAVCRGFQYAEAGVEHEENFRLLSDSPKTSGSFSPLAALSGGLVNQAWSQDNIAGLQDQIVVAEISDLRAI